MNLCEGIDENQEGAFSRFQFSILSFPFSIFRFPFSTYFTLKFSILRSSIHPSNRSLMATFPTPFGVPVKMMSPVFSVKNCEA